MGPTAEPHVYPPGPAWALEPAECRQEVKAQNYPPHFGEKYHEVPQFHIRIYTERPKVLLSIIWWKLERGLAHALVLGIRETVRI